MSGWSDSSEAFTDAARRYIAQVEPSLSPKHDPRHRPGPAGVRQLARAQPARGGQLCGPYLQPHRGLQAHLVTADAQGRRRKRRARFQGHVPVAGRHALNLPGVVAPRFARGATLRPPLLLMAVIEGASGRGTTSWNWAGASSAG